MGEQENLFNPLGGKVLFHDGDRHGVGCRTVATIRGGYLYRDVTRILFTRGACQRTGVGIKHQPIGIPPLRTQKGGLYIEGEPLTRIRIDERLFGHLEDEQVPPGGCLIFEGGYQRRCMIERIDGDTPDIGHLGARGITRHNLDMPYAGIMTARRAAEYGGLSVKGQPVGQRCALVQLFRRQRQRLPIRIHEVALRQWVKQPGFFVDADGFQCLADPCRWVIGGVYGQGP